MNIYMMAFSVMSRKPHFQSEENEHKKFLKAF